MSVDNIQNKTIRPILNFIEQPITQDQKRVLRDYGLDDYNVKRALALIPRRVKDDNTQEWLDKVEMERRGAEGELYASHFRKGQLIFDNYLILGIDDIYDVTDLQQNGQNYRETILLESVFWNLSRNKRVIKTAVPGLNGTIKEIMGFDDWNITITGSIIGRNPYNRNNEMIEKLKKVCNLNGRINLINPILNSVLGIDGVVVENYEIKPDEESTNITTFQINASSDNLIKFIGPIDSNNGSPFENNYFA